MKRLLICCATLGVFAPTISGAVDLGASGTTIVRIEERSTPGFAKEGLVPAIQFLGLDATNLVDGKLSLHLYGWGRHDFANTSAADKKNDGELAYGYLRYRFPKANAEVKAGRFFINEGVIHEQVDGLTTRADLAYGLTASLVAGAPTRHRNDNRGDYLAGGRIAYHHPGLLEIGASTLYEKGAVSQRFFQGITPPVLNAEDFRQLVGADLWLSPFSTLELTGQTTYNTSISAIAEHNYLLQLKPLKDLTIAATFTERLFKGYFAGTSLPTLFRPDALDDSTQFGGSITYSVAAPVEIAVDYRHIRRSSLGGTDRYGADARLNLPNIAARAGIGYHRYSAPDVTTAPVVLSTYQLSFHEVRGWLYHDQGKHFVGLDMLSHFYDDKNNPVLNGKSNDYEISATAGYHVLPNLTLSGDVSYGANALFQDEFKGLLRAEFAYNIADKGGRK